MGFQTTAAQSTFAPAVAGDFADHNPRASVTAGPGGIVAGPSGCYVGRFAWLSQSYIDPDNSAQIANNFGSGPVAGFVANQFQGLNTAYLSDSTLLIRAGFMVGGLYSAGGFWVLNSGSTEVAVGNTCYAALTSGLASFAAAATPSTVTCATSSIAAETWTGFTGSLAGNQLTITAAGTGTIYPGSTITAGGSASGTMIVSQLSGTTGGVGVYAVSIPEQTVASNSGWNGSYGLLTLGATPSGQFVIGALLSGSGTATATYINAYVTGNGLLSGSTMAVSNNTVVNSTTITATTNVATKWVAMSAGGAGEPIKISSWLNG